MLHFSSRAKRKTHQPIDCVKLVICLSTLCTTLAYLFLAGVYTTKYTPWYLSGEPQCFGRRGNHTRYITFVVKDSRRLGNYLFNIASLIGIAETNNMSAFLLADVPDHVQAHLDKLDISLPQIHSSCFNGFDKLTFREKTSRTYDLRTENLLDYFQVTSNKTLIYLKGFYQSWRYFYKSENSVRKTLRFSVHIRSQAKSIFERSKQQVVRHLSTMQNDVPDLHNKQLNLSKVPSDQNLLTIGIHVRRGDYAEHPMYHHEGYRIPDEKYFYSAMAVYERLYPDQNLIYIVTSENITWAKTLTSQHPMIFPEGGSGSVDMAILLQCDHMITSFGSFSWWAGYLAGGKVIYFKNWVASGSDLAKRVSFGDLYFAHWFGI